MNPKGDIDEQKEEGDHGRALETLDPAEESIQEKGRTGGPKD